MSTHSEKPNFIIFMTDQQRTLQYFDEKWVAKNLPNLTQFLKEGASFPENICNSSPCGPSRASIFSGMFPSRNGVMGNTGTVEPEQMNFANILNDQGYDVHYMGKLHMRDEFTSFSTDWPKLPLDSAKQTADNENNKLKNCYGMHSWTSPDFGTILVQGTDLSDSEIANLAGGSDDKYGDNDERVVMGTGNISKNPQTVHNVLEKLQSDAQKNPFCLVVSLLNPHDISLFPEGWDKVGYDESAFTGSEFDGFQLPSSYSDSLDGKPSVQAAYLNTACKGKLMDLPGSAYATNYLKFYAYLHKRSDQLLASVMDLITPETKKSTYLIRMADHGEMGMSHGGLQEKNFSMYNEMIRVPMIWIHPSIMDGKRTQLVSLIDLVPTLGTLAGADLSKYPDLQGEDYSECLINSKAKSQDALLFTYNYQAPPPFKPSSGPPPPKGMYEQNPNATQPPAAYPNNIYAMITKELKFAIYYSLDSSNHVDWSTVQYEYYDLKSDPDELTNLLAPPTDGGAYSNQQYGDIYKFYTELTALMKKKNEVFPKGWHAFKLT